jgi:hypothetical protein
VQRLVADRADGVVGHWGRILEARAAVAAPGLLFRRGAPSLGQLAAQEQVTEDRAAQGQATEERSATLAAPLAVGATDDPAEAAADRIADAAVGRLAKAAATPAGERSAATLAGDPRIHRRATNGDPGGSLDGETSQAVGAAQRAGGVPLGAATRERMETALGTGLSDVRVHAGTRARDLCGTVRAQAFTLGQHIFFRDGLPDEGSAAGRHLLAHELAHVTQQASPTVIRRSYLDGGHDWIARTRRRKYTRVVRERPEALRRVDDAVTGVRLSYDSGSLPLLRAALDVLNERIAAWRATPPADRVPALDRDVEELSRQAVALGADITSWRGNGLEAALAKHREQLDHVQRWLTEGSRSDKNVRVRNSVEWVNRGKARLYVLTETADRDYRAKVLLRQQGKELTVNDATYFPNPSSGQGWVGEEPPTPARYNTESATDPGNVVLNKRIKGWNERGYIAVTEDGSADPASFYQTLRHEVQHDADKFREPELSDLVDEARAEDDPVEELFQTALRMYKTEYRAHSYQGGEPGFGAPEAGTTRSLGRTWDNRQLAIFEHIRRDYPKVAAAVGAGTTPRHRRFIKEAHAYKNPDVEGFNKYNSVRIDDLYLALRRVPPATHDVEDPAVAAVLAAARRLNPDDVAYIRAGNQDTREEAFMLRAMVGDRLDGAALDAFRDVLNQLDAFRDVLNQVVVAFAPRVAKKKQPNF